MKKNSNLIFLVIAVVLAALVFLLTSRKTEPQLSTNPVTQEVSPVIQNTDDLEGANSDLDNVDLDEFDKELNQLETDASTF